MQTIDQIKNMQKQGYNDANIVTSLQQQGISPREINDALTRSKIKQAIGENEQQDYSPQNYLSKSEQLEETENFSQMQPSMMNQPEQNYQEDQSLQPPQPGDQYSQQQYYPEQYQGYDQGGDYQNYPQDYSQGISAETATEIAEQLLTEKISKIKSQLSDLVELKSILTAKIEKLDSRLEKVESVIDQLQMSLIRKSNEQEQNIGDIKNEMKAMQTGFSKILNPLTDNIRELESRHKTQKKESSKKEISKKK